jgi:hypothetical protein
MARWIVDCMADETLDKHVEDLRKERSARMHDALLESLVNSGSENLEGAHGEVCFHFDDGMTMQILFTAEKQTEHA